MKTGIKAGHNFLLRDGARVAAKDDHDDVLLRRRSPDHSLSNSTGQRQGHLQVASLPRAAGGDAPASGADAVVQAVQLYLRENSHTSADTAILLSQVGLQPVIQEALLGANNAKLSKIVLSRPDLFGTCDRANKSKTKLAVYLLLNASGQPDSLGRYAAPRKHVVSASL